MPKLSEYIEKEVPKVVTLHMFILGDYDCQEILYYDNAELMSLAGFSNPSTLNALRFSDGSTFPIGPQANGLETTNVKIETIEDSIQRVEKNLSILKRQLINSVGT